MREPPVLSKNLLENCDKSLVKKAILGLTDFLKKKNQNDLLDTYGCVVNLLINLKHIPSIRSSHPLYIDLPFPIYYRSDIRLCIIVRDPQKKWKEKLRELWNANESNPLDFPKVIGISKLRKNYPTMASKRTLSRSHDIFLCDTRIVDQMPRILGRTFITAGKLPIEVPIKECNLLEPIQHRLRQTFMTFRTGPSVSVKLGFSQDPPKHLYKNVIAVLSYVAEYFSSSSHDMTSELKKSEALKYNQIMSIYLTATNAPAIQVYLEPSILEALSNTTKSLTETKNTKSHSAETRSKTERVSKRLRMH